MTHCIIVGAGPGLGWALARKFGLQGFCVSLIARTETALVEQVARLKGMGIDARYAVADAGDAMQVVDALQRVQAEAGTCGVMIYNAAVLRPEGPLEITVENLRAEIEVNLVGALVSAQSVAQQMVAEGAGAILFTGGGLALEPYPEWTSLGIGKAALRSLACSLYKELAPKGVHVSVIAVCGIIERGGQFDPDLIASEYYRLATVPEGVSDREVIIQPAGSDPQYNDPERKHVATSLTPHHANLQR